MEGALLSVTIEWIILGVASVLAVTACLRDVFWCCGIFGFRNGMTGPASDVVRDGMGDDFADVYDQLTRLGFQPAGVYWERAMLSPKFYEYVFKHPKLDGFAAVYRLCGRDINVMLMTAFTDGAIIKTHDTPGDSFDESDYVVVRMPSQPVAQLVAEHQKVESRLVAAGHTVERTYGMERIVDVQRQAFFHPTANQDLRRTGRTLLGAKLFTMGTVVVPMGFMALACWDQPVIRTMCLLGAAAWVMTLSVLFLLIGVLMRLFSTGDKREVDDSPQPKFLVVHLAMFLPLGIPLIAGAAWKFGAATVALWTVIVVFALSGIDLVRAFIRTTRHPFASADSEPQA